MFNWIVEYIIYNRKTNVAAIVWYDLDLPIPLVSITTDGVSSICLYVLSVAWDMSVAVSGYHRFPNKQNCWRNITEILLKMAFSANFPNPKMSKRYNWFHYIKRIHVFQEKWSSLPKPMFSCSNSMTEPVAYFQIYTIRY